MPCLRQLNAVFAADMPPVYASNWPSETCKGRCLRLLKGGFDTAKPPQCFLKQKAIATGNQPLIGDNTKVPDLKSNRFGHIPRPFGISSPGLSCWKGCQLPGRKAFSRQLRRPQRFFKNSISIILMAFLLPATTFSSLRESSSLTAPKASLVVLAPRLFMV